MKKTDKKRENAIIGALNEACNIALDEYSGFQWLSHVVNFNDYPTSLRVVCVFDTNKHVAEANKGALRALIKEKLAAIDITFNHLERHISLDTEENCVRENNGQWNERFHSANFLGSGKA